MEGPEKTRPDDALGRSDEFLAFQQRLSRVARVDRPVLILGERGTGKELAASRLHFLSERWGEPFVTMNCAALAPTLIATELFGHEAGAFTGAARRRAGRFEAANGGTLFLDEIGSIPMEAQEKILRVVEYGSFERVGSSQSIRVNVRILGATHQNLVDLSERGLFKRDLLDRLSFEVLFLPPLRERTEDILLLANHFAVRMAYELGRPEVPEFTAEAIDALESHAWPGNIRELKNVVERATYRAEGARIDTIVFDPFRSPYALTEPTPAPADAPPVEALAQPAEVELDRPLPEAVRHLELRMLRAALSRSRHNQKKAASLLGLSYHQFRGLYRKYKAGLQEA
jgi:psp operon transcriptional activator